MYEIKPDTGSLFETKKPDMDYSGNCKVADIEFLLSGKNSKFEDGTLSINLKGQKKLGDGAKVGGYMRKNDKRLSETHPHWKGKLSFNTDNGKEEYYANAWENVSQAKKERYLKLKFTKIEAKVDTEVNRDDLGFPPDF